MTAESTLSGLVPEHRMLREALADLLAGTIPASRLEEASENGLLRDVWEGVAAGGWLELGDPCRLADEDALSVLDVTLLAEETGARLLPGPFALTTAFVVPLLTHCNSPWLSDVTTGKQLLTAILPRPVAVQPALSFNWHASGLNPAPDRVADGRYRNIPFAAQADAFLLPCRRGDQIHVAVIPTDRAGVTITPLASIDGTMPVADIHLSGVRLGSDEWLQCADDGLREALERCMAAYVSVLNGEAIGGMFAVLASAAEYVGERRQFGVRVGSFQAIKHRLADAFLQSELARALTHRAARSPYDEQGATDLVCARIRSAEAYIAVCETAIQVHGGFGVAWEGGLHFWYRRALIGRTLPAPVAAFRDVIGSQL